MNFLGKPCIDVGDLIRKAPAADLPIVHIQASGANFFSQRSGARPSVGRILMRSDDFKSISGGYMFGDLEFDSGTKAVGLIVTAATRLFPAADDDPAAPMILDIADDRFYRRPTTTRRFNLHDRNGALIYSTTNAGTARSYASILALLWSDTNLNNGQAYPGDPAVLPATAPEGLDFYGKQPVECLESVLNMVGYTLSRNLAGVYSFVEMGQTPAVRTWERVYDGRDVVPDVNEKNVVVLFPYHPRPDYSQNAGFGLSPLYPDYWPWGASNPAAFSGNTEVIYDGRPALLAAGTTTPSNSATLIAIAAERAAAWQKMRKRNRRKNIVYRGYQTYAAVGGDCTEVIYQERGRGPQTEIVSGDVVCMIDAQMFPPFSPKTTVYASSGYVPINANSTWIEAIRTGTLGAGNGLEAGRYFVRVDFPSLIQMDSTNPAGGGGAIYAKLKNYTTGVDVAISGQPIMQYILETAAGLGNPHIAMSGFTSIVDIANGDQISLMVKREAYGGGVFFYAFAGESLNNYGPSIWLTKVG